MRMRSRLSAVPILFGLLMAALVLSPSAQAGNSVFGWGYDYYGQLGRGSATTTGCDCVPTATPTMPGLSNVTQVAGSYYTSYALLSDGTVRAWGYNENGELGNGTTTASTAPVTVSGLSNVVAIDGGWPDGLALLSNGTVMAWGGNDEGQLGMGTTTGPEDCSGTPCSRIPRPVPGLTNVVAISAGYEFSLALLADGTVVTWGYDYYGQLGDGVGVQTGCECVDHPVPVPGLSNAIAISAGGYHALALLEDGTVRAWGYNYEGQLGNGAAPSTPTCRCQGPVQPTGLSGVREVGAGGYHSVALLASGGVMVWGENDDGQLGTGSSTGPEECNGYQCSRIPIPVPGLAGVQQIATHEAADHTVVRLADGTARAWGYGIYGQIGDGSETDRSSPAVVAGLSGASDVSASVYNSFALVGPSQTLNVALAGAGSGTVASRTGVCPSLCAAHYPQGRVAFLRAKSTAGGFAGFSGPCTGTASCQVKMETDQTVTATFGVPKGTAITKAKIEGKKKKATFTFTAPGAITGFECLLIKPKPKKAKKGKGKKHSRVDLKKAAKPKFAACTGPKAYKNLKPGSYTFKVRALDILGADATPALKKFTIKKPKPKHHKKKH